MSENHVFDGQEGSEEFSLDELLAETRRQLDSTPGEMDYASDDQFFSAAGDLDFGEPDYGYEQAQQGESFPEPTDYDASFGDFGSQEPYPEEGDYLPQEDYDEEDYYYDDEEEAPPPKKPVRSHHKRIVPLFVKVLLYVVIVGLVAVGGGYGAWECAQDVMAFGRSDETLSVSIQEGQSVEDIAQMLKEHGVIKYPWLFKLYCDFTDSGDTMEPGTYEIAYNFDYHALVNGMVASSPNRSTVRVTIPEGMTCAQIFSMMEKNNVCSAAELEECAANTQFDYWFLEDVPYGDPNRLEGFLFPDTYDFYEADDPERVLDKLLVNFEKKFSDEAVEQLNNLNYLISQRLSDRGYDEDYISTHTLTVRDLLIVASMIEKESAGASESGNIASVIYNRLCDPGNFPYLNIDATVVYALGGVNGSLTEADLQVDSPYNTYIHAGLPVGPIANPGLSSITAALNPSETGYYFYALDNSTGFHHFSETYEEHNAFLGGEYDGE